MGREYINMEETAMRQEVWSDNLKLIHEHNKLDKSYTLAMNHLGDLTHEEYRNMMLGTKITVPERKLVEDEVEDAATQKSVDWRSFGYVTGVKNQGQCGSCWAFSSTGSMEGALKRKRGQLISLSEQNLVDCSSSYGNMGCNGGLMDYAFKYVMDNGGVDSEASYQYEAQQNVCRFNRNNTAVRLTGYMDVSQGSETALKVALSNVGPVSIAIDASHQSFQFYHSGVYNEPGCSSTQLDHGVLVVGYGTTNVGADYWIVKNSWSPGWGEGGYVRMTRNKWNQCGVASAASYPIAA